MPALRNSAGGMGNAEHMIDLASGGTSAQADRAARYVEELGFALCHIEEGCKGPKTGSWQKRPIKDPKRARDCFRDGGNIGLVHQQSGTLCLDIDDYEGAKRALERVGINFDKLLETDSPKIVGKRGAKPIYRVPEGIELKRVALQWATAETCRKPHREQKLETIFELRAGATQDLLPGSLHPDGMTYVWQNEPLTREDIPELPGGLLALAQHWKELKPLMLEVAPGYSPPRPKPRAPRQLHESGVIDAFNKRYTFTGGDILEPHDYTRGGEGRWLSPHSSTGVAGVVLFKGEDGLERVYSHHGSDPLSTGHAEDAFGAWLILEHGGDITGAVREAANALGMGWSKHSEPGLTSDAQTSISMPEEEALWTDLEPLPALYIPVPALPPKLIPDPLRPWLEDIAERTSLPLEFVACPALVALGSVVGRNVGIYPKRFDDWLVVPNLWGGIIGRPGVMKTAAISEATKPLRALAVAARERFQEEASEVEAEKARLELEISALKEQAKRDAKKGGISSNFQVTLQNLTAQLSEATVIERRYITQDATTEKLGELLRDNPRGMLLSRDELAGWLRTLERPGREGEREFYLEAWNGEGDYTFDRIGRGTVQIDALTLSILGAIQPGKLERYLKEALDGGGGADGLLQRFQLIVWPDNAGEYKQVDRYPDIAARKRVDTIFERLDALDPATLGLDAQEGDIPGLHFIDDAQTLFDLWRSDLEQRFRGVDLTHKPAFESHLSKYRSLMPSLALLFHLVTIADGGPSGPVSLAATQLAGGWCDYLEAHARKLYALEVSSHVKAAQRIAQHIEEGDIEDGITVRDLYRREWEGLNDRETVMSGLTVLAEVNWLRVEEKGTGGRPTQQLRLHPSLRVKGIKSF